MNYLFKFSYTSNVHDERACDFVIAENEKEALELISPGPGGSVQRKLEIERLCNVSQIIQAIPTE